MMSWKVNHSKIQNYHEIETNQPGLMKFHEIRTTAENANNAAGKVECVYCGLGEQTVTTGSIFYACQDR